MVISFPTAEWVLNWFLLIRTENCKARIYWYLTMQCLKSHIMFYHCIVWYVGQRTQQRARAALSFTSWWYEVRGCSFDLWPSSSWYDFSNIESQDCICWEEWEGGSSKEWTASTWTAGQYSIINKQSHSLIHIWNKCMSVILQMRENVWIFFY